MTTLPLLILLNLTPPPKKQSIKKKESVNRLFVVAEIYICSKWSLLCLKLFLFCVQVTWRLATPLQDDGAEVSEAHDDVHGDGGAQVVSIQAQVPAAAAEEGMKPPLTETFQLVFSGRSHRLRGRYLSLGTRDWSRSSSSKVTGQIWVPLIPGSTSSQRLRNKHEGPARSCLILRHSDWEGKRLTHSFIQKNNTWAG